MKSSATPRQLSFESRLESISDELEYYALPVPAHITRALGTHAAVPVSARINGSKPFLVSLYTRGGGRHGMRVKASVRAETKIKGGDRVRVEIAIIDRAAEVPLPADVSQALRAAGVLATFKALPKGQQRYTIRRIDEAAKPETRAKRIQAAVAEARTKK